MAKNVNGVEAFKTWILSFQDFCNFLEYYFLFFTSLPVSH